MKAGISIKLCKQFHYDLSNVHPISAISPFMHVSSLSASLNGRMEWINKRAIKWQFEPGVFNYLFKALSLFHLTENSVCESLQRRRNKAVKFYYVIILRELNNLLIKQLCACAHASAHTYTHKIFLLFYYKLRVLYRPQYYRKSFNELHC